MALLVALLAGCAPQTVTERLSAACARGDEASCAALEERAAARAANPPPATMRAPTSTAVVPVQPRGGLTVGSSGGVGGGIDIVIGSDPFENPMDDPFRRRRW
ncbi:MAG: hypothetical protein ACOCYE_12830 [Pseudomonadota bacterium]